MLEQLPASKLTEWGAYFELVDEDAFEEARAQVELDNLRTGLIAATIANCSPISKKHDFVPSDFMGAKKKPTMADKLKGFFGSIAGTTKSKR